MFTSLIRTIVPIVWGSVVAWLLLQFPQLEALEADLLAYADVITVGVTTVSAAAWYALWRWLEPKLPDWLSSVTLGSAQQPVYPVYDEGLATEPLVYSED